ncbi:MAG: helix-turn-helix transcriptional regulator [Pseudomonadota bacterium]
MSLHLEGTGKLTPGRQSSTDHVCGHRDLALLASYLERGGYFLLDFYPQSHVLRPRPGMPSRELGPVALGSLEDLLGQKIKQQNGGPPVDLVHHIALDGIFDLSTEANRVAQFRIMSRVIGPGHMVVLLVPVNEIGPAAIVGKDTDSASWRKKLFDLVLYGSGDAASADQAEEYGLSPRMVECLRWTALGKTSEEIAMILELSSHTVNNYMSAATQKLNAVNRVQAVAYAITLGIISIAPKS